MLQSVRPPPFCYHTAVLGIPVFFLSQLFCNLMATLLQRSGQRTSHTIKRSEQIYINNSDSSIVALITAQTGESQSIL